MASLRYDRRLLNESGHSISQRLSDDAEIDFVLKRSDGWTLAATRDLASAAFLLWPETWISVSMKNGASQQLPAETTVDEFVSLVNSTLDAETYELGGISFPSKGCPDAARDWCPAIRWRAIARDILVVARSRIVGEWKAYVGTVPGVNHDDEFDAVLNSGNPLLEATARSLFPNLKDIPYAK